LLVLR